VWGSIVEFKWSISDSSQSRQVHFVWRAHEARQDVKSREMRASPRLRKHIRVLCSSAASMQLRYFPLFRKLNSYRPEHAWDSPSACHVLRLLFHAECLSAGCSVMPGGRLP
jgi:hypothetical protein